MNSTTSSFTKDIFTRLKQINNDVKLLKENQTTLVNTRIDRLEEQITRLEKLIETKFDILFEKMHKNITTEVEETNNDLHSKLDNIDIITNSSTQKQIDSNEIHHISNEYIDGLDNILDNGLGIEVDNNLDNDVDNGLDNDILILD
jgi:molecular chaperone GrpE (heat shock protein)